MNTEVTERERFEEKKSLAIKDIIENGLITPKERFLGMVSIKKLCSPGILFWGVGDCMFLSLTVAVLCWLLFLNTDTKYICSGIFCISPLVYLLSYIFTLWKERRLNLYEMKMTCRYHLRQVIVYRMLYFGLINMALNTAFIWVLQAKGAEVLLWRYLLISFLGIFLFGICALVIRMKENLLCDVALAPAIWIVFNMAVSFLLKDKIEYFLYHVETYILAGVLILLCICYAALILFRLAQKGEGEMYAFGK